MGKLTYTFLICLVLFAGLLRFYKISENPPGLYWDEASIGYNAYSILKTGKDEYGYSLPLSFKSFGDYKLPVYIYATVFSVGAFGLSEFSVRFTSAISGVMTVILLYFLVLELFNNRRLALLSSLFLSISPWHLQFSRAAFEANLALFFLVAGALVFLRSQKTDVLLFISSILFSLALFTYPTARVFILFFVPILFMTFRGNFISKIKTHRSLVFFLIPLLLSYFLIFMLPHAFTRFNVVSSLGGKNFFQWPTIFFTNYLSHFSFDFLFFLGDQIPRHNLSKFGNLYFFQIPLLLIGLFQLSRYNRSSKIFILSWLFISPIAASLTQPSPHSLRSLNMVIPLTIISGIGALKLIELIRSKMVIFKIFSYTVIILLPIYFFFNYLHLYYHHYPKTSGLDWQEGNRELAQELFKRESNYRDIYISDFLGQPYLYLLFYGKINPVSYRGSLTIDGFGKYHFVNKWPEEIAKGDLWALSFNDKFLVKGRLLKEIKITNGDVIYKLWELE